jgi:hypothetical protein
MNQVHCKSLSVAALKIGLLICCVAGAASIQARSTDWPVQTVENKPGTRWWWLGNAVDKKNLTWNLEELAKVGIGTVEITPIYGVQGKDSLEISYLSPRWMDMLKHTQSEAKRLNMLVDMNQGTGWPFGGPSIDIAHAATCLVIQKQPVKALPGGRAAVQTFSIRPDDPKQRSVAKLEAILFVGSDGAREQIPGQSCMNGVLKWGAAQDGTLYAVFSGKTFQQVKRAAPGGEGLVMNHLSQEALSSYLERFDQAFTTSETAWPHCFFNDSYEVYEADWSENLLTAFRQTKGYDLIDYLPEFLGTGDSDIVARVVYDYRDMIHQLLLNQFTKPWTEWAHRRGIQTRNQAHGSPGNLLDLYGAVDIPECESFGITSFDIPGCDWIPFERSAIPIRHVEICLIGRHVTGKPFLLLQKA